MSNDRSFAAFILTHGRADKVTTYRTLRGQGYTGRIFLVVDDEDAQLDYYRQNFPGEVVVFSKAEAAELFDEGDNFNDRRAVVYARNALWGIAKKLGVTHFITLDDDYSLWLYRLDENGFYGHWKARLDWLFDSVCDYLDSAPFASIALAQGGDHIGGGAAMKSNKALRKAMNTFVCRTDRPFEFLGRINEDVTSYTCLQRAGTPFLTILSAQVNQETTQSNDGGLTDIYKAMGTYIKSFYSVMYTPSAVKVGSIQDAGCKGGALKGVGHLRLHHRVAWNAVAPKIIRERHRKSSTGSEVA